MKRFSMFLMFVMLSVCLCGCLSESETAITVAPNTLLTSVMKLGEPQDAILLQTTDSAVLIDTGTARDAASVVRTLNRAGVTELDALIITHFDQDHVGGADAVLSAVSVDNIYVPDYTANSPEYNAYVSAASNVGISPIAVTDTITLTIGGATYEINPTQIDVKEGEDNNWSLITTVTYGETRLLFMGDAENARIKEFNKTEPSHVDFIKMPHHGKYHKPLKDLLDLTTPHYSCITCSNQDRAEDKTLELLEERNITNYNTSSGDVFITTDGTTLTLQQD